MCHVALGEARRKGQGHKSGDKSEAPHTLSR